MNNISKIKEKCYGCMACSYVCPKKAVSFAYDEYGFYIPHIDSKLCINCGKCLNDCPANNSMSLTHVKKEYYGWSNSAAVRNSSASGGAFYEIAKKFIADGGIVYGAFQQNAVDVFHIRIDKIECLFKIQKSKYVQSNIVSVYSSIEVDLKQGKRVLFSGTPCQVEGIKRVFKHDSKLYTVDLVCFGFLSNGAYELYLNGVEKKYGSQIKSVIFRDKANNNRMNIELCNGEHIYCDYRDSPSDGIYTYFIYRGGMKTVCSSCPFRQADRTGDLTISDYPYHKSDAIDKDRNGMSVIYVCTDKGFEIIDGIDMTLQRSDDDLINDFSRIFDMSAVKKEQKKFRYNYKKYYNKPEKFLKSCKRSKNKGLIKKGLRYLRKH